MTASACPKCGAPNNWLHPEIQRFAVSLESSNFLPEQSRVSWKGYRVWGTASKKHPGHDKHPLTWGPKLMIASILLGIVGFLGRLTGASASAGLLFIAPVTFIVGLVASLFGSLADSVPPGDQQLGFELDFSCAPPKWTCNDEQYWAEVRRFFNL